MQSSAEWLKAHGLEANGLTLSRILSSLGFQQRSGEVQCLGRAVASQYCMGLFLQHPDQAGHVYNLVDTREQKLQEVEARLLAVVSSLKQRLQWLNSGSRKTCGVLSERRVIMALLGDKKVKIGTSPTVRVAANLLIDQGSHLTHLNIISGTSTWKQELREGKEEGIAEAVQWLYATTPTSSHETASTLTEALKDAQGEAVYLIVEGNQETYGLRDLAGKCTCTPVNVVVVDCKCPALLEECQYLASACGGRCHSDGGKGILCIPRTDVLDTWRELELARDTLAQIQALHMEVAEVIKAHHGRRVEASSGKICAQSTSVKKYSSTRSVKARCDRTVEAGSGNMCTQSASVKKCSSTHSASVRKCSSAQSVMKRAGVSRVSSSIQNSAGNESRNIVPWTPLGVQHVTGVVKGSTVLACCKQDGFYYKGTVVRTLPRQRVDVRFLDRSNQTTPVSQLIVVGGAGPRPQLKSEDYVLCCVRQRQGRHCSKFGVCDFYIPAQVQVAPVEQSRGHTLFSVTTFNGERVSCTRSGLEKISESRYRTTSCRIAHCQQETSGKMEESPLLVDENAGLSESSELGNSDTVDLGDHNRVEQEIQPGRDHSSSYCLAPPLMPEREDRATATDVPEMLEKETSVFVPTHEQAVGTGPQVLDQSTSTTECRVEATGNKDSQVHVSGCQVFCCWPGMSWFSRASVLGSGRSESTCIVRADSEGVADIPTSHIITSSASHMHSILMESTVLAPHPLFPKRFVPGIVTGVVSQSSDCCVELYSGVQVTTARAELVLLSPAQHEMAVRLLQEKEREWVGQAVVARRDDDGVYYPAVVTEKLDKQCFKLQWTDGSHQKQSLLHMFGSLTSRRELQAGDHVLALAMPGIGACLPGTLTGTHSLEKTGVLEVKFSDGERQTVSADKCFWISHTYFVSAVEYISTAFTRHHLPS